MDKHGNFTPGSTVEGVRLSVSGYSGPFLKERLAYTYRKKIWGLHLNHERENSTAGHIAITTQDANIRRNYSLKSLRAGRASILLNGSLVSFAVPSVCDVPSTPVRADHGIQIPIRLSFPQLFQETTQTPLSRSTPEVCLTKTSTLSCLVLL